MKQAVVTIKYEEEKLNAVRQYMEKKDADLDKELYENMNRLWEKYVPQAVREYIESREESKKKDKKAKREKSIQGKNDFMEEELTADEEIREGNMGLGGRL